MSGFPVERLSLLTLGTAQLGLDYGIANTRGRPSQSAAEAILDGAREGGITCLDTARAYGDAETRIGAWMERTGHRFLLVSKLTSLGDLADEDAAQAVRLGATDSCRTLGVERLDGYLTHRTDDLLRPAVADALRALEAEGRIGGFGTSAYTPEHVDRALAVPDLTLIQAPVNALDWRLATSGALERCVARGVSVFARSVFCQGLLFLDPDCVPPYLAPVREVLREFHDLAASSGMTPAALALGVVRSLPGVASIVIGVDSRDQLAANLAAGAAPTPDLALLEAVRAISRRVDPAIIDPRRWPSRA